jgi:hypothetical protein
MPTPYRAGAPGAVRAWPENPDEFNLIASLKTGSRFESQVSRHVGRDPFHGRGMDQVPAVLPTGANPS